MGLGGQLQDPSTVISHEASRAIQIVATIASGFSIIGTSITIYWFFMMRRNLRRNLVLYLVLADFFKSLWYLSFSSVSLHRGAINSSTAFCQGFGFLLQASTMACDFAILIMSVHMYLQIFNSTSKIFGHDGLYRFRHTATVLWCALPILTGVLAFIRGRQGYLAQGPFCTLPIRPYWYRLALQWIPRYLIFLYIMFVAVRIYLHVGQGFRVFARENDKSSSNDHSPESMDPEEGPQELRVVKKRAPKPGELQDLSGLVESSSALVDGSNAELPTSSHSTWPPTLSFSADGFKLPSRGHSRRSSRHTDGAVQAAHLQVPPEAKGPRSSISSISSWRTSADMSMGIGAPSLSLAPIDEFHAVSGDGMDLASADTPLKKRRQAIQRQLRLLFIYPVTYLMVWTIPFVYHSMYYSDYYAAHPIPLLAALSIFCLTIAGLVDCIVFGWREKPWQHVPGSDGTFLGSFMFWRFNVNKTRTWSTPAPARVPSLALDDDPSGPAQKSKKAKHLSGSSRQTSSNSTKPMIAMHKKTYSGTSDRATRAAEQAAERLALERHDRQSRICTRESSIAAGRGEWFERQLSDCISPTKEKFEFEFDV